MQADPEGVGESASSASNGAAMQSLPAEIDAEQVQMSGAQVARAHLLRATHLKLAVCRATGAPGSRPSHRARQGPQQHAVDGQAEHEAV